jgi:predicted nuclease of predicted toxin-antitoxin system
MKQHLKLLIEVGVGKSVENWLKNASYDVLALRDINPRMSDKDILKVAVSEGRLLITMDKDFGELVYHSSKPHLGVLLLRLEDATSDEKVEVIKKIFTEHSEELANHFCVYQNGILRIR